MEEFEDKKEKKHYEITYFDDFIRKIEKECPPTSWYMVIEEIEFAREAGPIRAQLRRNPSGAYELLVPIGFGHRASIELEYDRSGKLQPVMGGIIKE